MRNMYVNKKSTYVFAVIYALVICFFVSSSFGADTAFAVQKKSQEIRQAKAEVEAQALAKELSKKTFTLTEKVGENGKLFGAVTTADVAEALKAQFDLDVDKKKIVIPDEIKTVGEYTVQVKLLASAVAEIRMSVVADA